MLNIAFDENGEKRLVKIAIKTKPITDPNITLQLVMPIKTRKRAPNINKNPIKEKQIETDILKIIYND